MNTKRALLAALFVAALRAHAQVPPGGAAEAQALWNAYQQSVYDSAVYQRWNVRPLRPLVADENGQATVAMLTWRDAEVGEELAAGPFGMWVTGVPEVQTICRGFTGDVPLQLRQLLGLPPDADIVRFLVLSVRVADVFRPAPDGSTRTSYPCECHGDEVPADCGNRFPDDTSDEHYRWMATTAFFLHSVPKGYPWTHLGYTYNWKPGADRYGASEYVIRPEAKAKVLEKATIAEYCAPTNTSSEE